MARTEIESWAEKHKVTIESVFVPFSQSRNKDEKHKSLNWRITVRRDGRDILHTGYSAGIGHAPDYRSKTPPLFRGSYANSWRNDALEVNCELGFAAAGGFNGAEPDRKKPIKPDACDVLWSLSLDARVLDNSGFED